MNIKTITSTEGVNEVDFGSSASRFYWFQNLGTTTVHVSGKADITAGSDGVAELAAGGVACIETLGGKVYVLGAGIVQIHNTGDKFCPVFKKAPAQSGGEAVDAYTKSESDARYPLLANTVPRGLGFGYGTCATAAATAAKTASILGTNTPNFVNRDGGIIVIKFTNAVGKNSTLNVNNGGAKSLFYHGKNIVDGVINAGDTVTLMLMVNVYHVVAVENSGNADTLDGRHASEFVLASTIQQVNASRIEVPDNVNVGEWLVENAKIGTMYFCTGYEVGQTNLPGGLSGLMWFSFDGNRHYARVMVSDTATRDFILNKVNNVGEWKEISTTPIKSTSFSGTTNAYGDVLFTSVGNNKIPLFVDMLNYYAIPFRSAGNYWLHLLHATVANNSQPAANVAVSGTVYYAEI